jgi:proline iminopeptidase
MPHFTKTILPHEKFYIAAFLNQPNAPYLVFIHGGPGFNCGAVEYFIECEDYFKSLDYNIILYDQRACGRSAKFFDNMSKITHENNVTDLQEIYKYLIEFACLKIKGLIGHSYGAKLLFDFYKVSQLSIPGIFVSTADSILTPRLNNLMSDLAYLKKTDPAKYQDTHSQMDSPIDLKKIWQLTEELAPLFQENKDRHYLYWANLATYEKMLSIQKQINLPSNPQVFMNVRKDLYSSEANSPVDINSLKAPHLWINGFQDVIMGEPTHGLSKKSKITLFSKSSHYPHLEENELFCESVNAFIKSI